MRPILKPLALAGFFCTFFMAVTAFSNEVILQYFNTSWKEITRRIPELAEAGYDALWLPPPTKAGGTLSVGYDPYDRFDLGDKDQNGIPTRYGTMTELIYLVEVAHRFGIRIYFDSVMAHNGSPWPTTAPGTLGPTGFVPEDYHLIRTSETTYSGPPGPNSSDEWQILNRTWFGLDIAQESPNDSFGWSEGDDYGKWSGVRQPAHPEYYRDTDLSFTFVNGAITNVVNPFADREPYEDIGYTNSSSVFVSSAAGNGRFDWQDVNSDGQHNAGEPCEPFTDTGLDPSRTDRQTTAWGYGDGIYNMGNPVAEDVNVLLFRAVCRLLDLTGCDGFRLDAVKHVPYYYFGQVSGSDKDYSDAGYCGQIQKQFNFTHGYSDWDNHRDTVFSTESSRDDAMIFGEHLGEPPSKDNYVNAGMRLADDSFLNAIKNNVGSTLEGMDTAYYGVSSPGQRVLYVMSHDNNYLWGGDREQAFAIMLSREGLPIVYTDGYNQSGSPDWFPKPAEIPFLGQWSSSYIPNLLDINRHFGWGYQSSRWNSWDFTSYARYDPAAGADDHGVTMIFMMAKNYLGYWPTRDVDAMFPEGARLVNYSYHDGQFWVKVSGGKLRNLDDSLIYVAPGKYYVFSWRTPQMPMVWGEGLQEEMQPITIFQNGEQVPTMTSSRTDGYSGDPAFNPYGLPDADTTDRTYSITLPRVTSATNLTFLARADGSAENILMKLDGGIDLNSQMSHVSQTAGTRDNPPALTSDKFLGYEQMQYVKRVAEKFAARDVSRNVIGSMGGETYWATIGSNGFTVVDGGGWNTGDGTATWVYHDPENQFSGTTNQFAPLPQDAANQPVDIWVKAGYSNQASKVFIYYTTNNTNPEGSAGVGKDDTLVVEADPMFEAAHDGTGVAIWWKGTLAAMPANTAIRYKIGVFHTNAPSVFPWTDEQIAIRYRMETQFEITNFNGSTVPYYLHNDYGRMKTGLDEGYHILRTKAILGRSSGDTPIYRQFTQTFYYDTLCPTGAFLSPAADGVTLTASTVRVVTHSDMTVEEAWFRIEDTDSSNDDSATGVNNGNNVWVRATEGYSTSPFARGCNEKEWTFNYVNIPTSGVATLQVRLREATSSNNMELNDADGHFTTLERTVMTGGSGVGLYIHSPSSDGGSIAVGTILEAYFSQSLADGLTDGELLACFSITLDDEAQSNSLFTITRNVTASAHAIRMTLPNLYNGQPEYQHTLQVAFDRDGYPSLSAQRLAYAVADDDSNDDGIPDYWERQWSVPVGSIVATNNDDGDILSNEQEYIANTNPFDSNDCLLIENSYAGASNPFSLEFEGKSNRNYFVWYTEDLLQLSDTWQLATPLIDPIEGQGHTAQFIDTTTSRTNRYYRLEVRMP